MCGVVCERKREIEREHEKAIYKDIYRERKKREWERVWKREWVGRELKISKNLIINIDSVYDVSGSIERVYMHNKLIN